MQSSRHRGLTRRELMARARDGLALSLLPRMARAQAAERRATAGEVGADAAGVFLHANEMRGLRVLVAHFIPGPPDDPDPGALEAGAAEYIDLLLGAFETQPPRIFAGGPFSFRDGGGPNAFAQFLELDPLEELVWRTRIEGSRGLAEREWNGPVVGWQQRYREGLGRLDEAAAWLGAERFALLAGWRLRWLLRLATGELDSFLDLAFAHTLEGTYGAPEYGGNRERIGWSYTRWPGDQQPHRYSAAEISAPDASQSAAVAEARSRALAERDEPVPDPTAQQDTQ